MSAALAFDESQPGLSFDLAEAIRAQNLGARTSQTYQHWIGQYLAYFDLSSPTTLGEKNVKEFLGHLRRKLSLSRARLNQAKEAIVFFYDKVLHKPLKQQELS